MSDKVSRLRAYFAAPLFNEMERNYNSAIVSQLEDHIDVFLPQRDGGLLMQHVKDGMSPDRAGHLIFDRDLAAMEGANLLIAVLDGAAIDEGVAFEIGYMFALGRTCVGLQTDVRRALPTGNNPMIGSAMRFVFQSVPQLVGWIEQAGKDPRVRAMPRASAGARDARSIKLV
jgi:nucleoside 2-deoxyribosyltransferase